MRRKRSFCCTGYVIADNASHAKADAEIGLFLGLEQAVKILRTLKGSRGFPGLPGYENHCIYRVKFEEVPVLSVKPMVCRRERKARRRKEGQVHA